ncbi:hypothetical protein [Herminiimonas sp. CN]|uniref:hypothetical protein n=1 Tax=Herminiimonas sp. CN TaxID=1349818 RepID=UPI000473015C|nr:hypothetical protein [Herminiimonas sp. CN]
MQLFTNNADSELNGAIDAAALSITLKTGTGAKFPTPTVGDYFLVTLYQKVGAAEINHEIVKCTARAGDVLTVVRAQEGTTAMAFSNADPIELRMTAGAAQAAVATADRILPQTVGFTVSGGVTSKTLTVPLDASVSGDNTGDQTAGSGNIGYLNIPQNSKSAAYTLGLDDAGKHILHPSADTTARIFTIPANGSVAFPIGSAITFANQNGGGVITISITTDIMRLAGTGTTGSRTLAANGIATAMKLTATEWIISGTGLS